MLDATLTKQSDAALTDEQQDFVQALRDFCEREVKGRGRDDDPHDDAVAKQMADLGWYGLEIDEEYGGSGGSFLDATLFLEETTRGRAPIAGYGVTLICVGAPNRLRTQDPKGHPLGRGGDRGGPA